MRRCPEVHPPHPTSHPSWPDVGDPLPQVGGNHCRQRIHSADREDEGICAGKVLPPDERIARQCPPSLPRGPSDSRSDIHVTTEFLRHEVRPQPGVRGRMCHVRAVERQRVAEDQHARGDSDPLLGFHHASQAIASAVNPRLRSLANPHTMPLLKWRGVKDQPERVVVLERPCTHEGSGSCNSRQTLHRQQKTPEDRPGVPWSYGDSNPRPLACHASALPAEL